AIADVTKRNTLAVDEEHGVEPLRIILGIAIGVNVSTRSPQPRYEAITPTALRLCLGVGQPGGKKAMIGGFFSRRAALAAAVECSFLLALGAAAPRAHAAEVKVMSTVALTPTLGELIPKYESSSGNKLMIVYSTIADLKKRIEAGETGDVMILSRPALDDLQTQGKVAQGSIVNVGSSYVAIGV